MSEPRPLVTFALFTYNQEAYVAEAVAGALSQEYSPLEIIISDDASTDRTFDIIREMIDRYRGRHQIRLIRNKANLGIGAHVTKVANLARGELIIPAAGDDISLPRRATAMVDLWEGLRRKPDLLCCDFERIDAAGRSIGKFHTLPRLTLEDREIARDGSLVVGAAATWTRRLWQIYPDLPSDCIFEDHVLSLRAAMAGGIARDPAVLVRYRAGTGISSPPPRRNDSARIAHRRIWADRRKRTLEIQAEDAHRHRRTHLVTPLEQHRRELAIVVEVYRTGRLPAMRCWRGMRGLRSLRHVMGALVMTRIPSLSRLFHALRDRSSLRGAREGLATSARSSRRWLATSVTTLPDRSRID